MAELEETDFTPPDRPPFVIVDVEAPVLPYEAFYREIPIAIRKGRAYIPSFAVPSTLRAPGNEGFDWRISGGGSE